MNGELDGEFESGPEEPIVESPPRQELGFLFEKFLLGGKIQTGNDYQQDTRDIVNDLERVDGSRGLDILLYPSDDSSQHVDCMISDETILMLLHERAWRPNKLMPMYLLPVNEFSDDETIDEMSDEEASYDEVSDYEVSDYEVSEYEVPEYEMSDYEMSD